MKTLSRISSLAFVLCLSGNASATELYVSTDGKPDADGSSEKPYASLPDAVEALRTLRKAGDEEPATIFLREGRHPLNTTLVLGLEDGRSATADPVTFEKYGAGETMEPAFLTIAAHPGETPVLDAGIPVTGWKRLESVPAELPAAAAGNVWVADMPESLDRFYTMYDAQAPLARASGDGFTPTKTGDKRTLYFPEGALMSWDNLDDVEIRIRPGRAWLINMLPLASVDVAAGIAKTKVSATYEMGKLPQWVIEHGATSSVWVENVPEALDEPGEWVANTKTRKIYLWPSDPAADGSPQGIVAPALSEMIRVEGKIDEDGPTDQPVRGIAFSGLTFTHADRHPWTSDDTRLGWGLQHDWDMFDQPTAILRFRGAESCLVSDCRFVDSGGSGVRFDLHAQRNRVENSEFAHLGEAGVLLAGYGAGTKDANHHNDVINNHFHHFSEVTWHSPGVWAWQSGHNRIAHNQLNDCGYSAILITNRIEPDRSLSGEGGKTIRQNDIPDEVKANVEETYQNWKVREKYNHSRHNLCEYNEISGSVKLLSDGNSIYVSGAGGGNIVRYNFIHDNLSQYFSSAIRCDDDQHETLIQGNVLYNNNHVMAGIVSKGVNDIINNFIVAPRKVPMWGYISLEWNPVDGSRIHHNIIVSHPDGGKAYAEKEKQGLPPESKPNLETTLMDSNLYFHPTDDQWVEEHLLRMRAVGQEKSSRFGGPLFTDPANGDFSFKPGSPALDLGIEPLDVSKMGLQ
ncbi:MAG: right-handed parallel beta-helix repeat-containing protein [Luteolibacter sp.]